MRLFDWQNSYNSRKIRAVAFETDTKIECVPVNMQSAEHKTAAHMVRNPNGKVPVLEDGNFNLWESDAICLYIAGKDPSHRLLPVDVEKRAVIDQWLFWKAFHLQASLSKVAYERLWKARFNLGTPDEAAVEAAMPEVTRYLTVLDQKLATSEYVAGDLSVADFSLLTVFSFRDDIGLDMSPYGHINAWIARMESRPSWQQTKTW